jgi:hypothetical protein
VRRDGQRRGNGGAPLEGFRLHELRFGQANECVFAADAVPEFVSELTAARTIRHEFELEGFAPERNVWGTCSQLVIPVPSMQQRCDDEAKREGRTRIGFWDNRRPKDGVVVLTSVADYSSVFGDACCLRG